MSRLHLASILTLVLCVPASSHAQNPEPSPARSYSFPSGGGRTAPLKQAWRQLVDGKPSTLMVETWRMAKAQDCKGNNLDGRCAEVCSMKDGGDALTKCTTQQVSPRTRRDGWNAGLVCAKTRCAVVLAKAATKGAPARIRLIDARLGARAPVRVTDIGKPSGTVVAVIPPVIWEWMTGSPFCCQDCWATHRSLGLPCSVDLVCCAMSCTIDPGCGGGTGGGGAGPGTGSGPSTPDGESCGPSREVEGATVEYDGMTCYFDGTVDQVVFGGECLEIASDGVVYGCEGDVVLEEEEPREVETPGP